MTQPNADLIAEIERELLAGWALGCSCDVVPYHPCFACKVRPAVALYVAQKIEAAVREEAARREQAEDALQRKGYRRTCDIPACNCGDSWMHGGRADARLREIGEVLGEFTQGRTLLSAIPAAIEAAVAAERERVAVLLDLALVADDYNSTEIAQYQIAGASEAQANEMGRIAWGELRHALGSAVAEIRRPPVEEK